MGDNGRKNSNDIWLAGVDGCRAGWIVAFVRPAATEFVIRVVERFSDLIAASETPPSLPSIFRSDCRTGQDMAAVPQKMLCGRCSGNVNRRFFRFLRARRFMPKRVRSQICRAPMRHIDVAARWAARRRIHHEACRFKAS